MYFPGKGIILILHGGSMNKVRMCRYDGMAGSVRIIVPALSLFITVLLTSCSGMAGNTAPVERSARSIEKDDETVAHRLPPLVIVRGGTFLMGDEVGDLWDGTRPVHQVTLSYDFWMGRYQVTFEEFDLFCRATGRHPLYDHGWGRERRPVMRLTWWDMADFCNWLSLREGLPPAYDDRYDLLDLDGNVTTDITRVAGYRLPTEAEWEYAAMGGHEFEPGSRRYLYSGSDDLDEVGWYSGNSGEEWIFTGTATRMDYSQHGAALYEGKSTWPVGEKKPNQLGIHDMSGNVWEWCHDRYGEYSPEPKLNPIGPAEGHVRVIRGGSWIFGSNDCRIANRYWRGAYDKVYRLGFRIARTELQ